MSASGNFVACAGYVGLGAVTGAVAGVIVVTGILTPLSMKYACWCAAPFGLVSALCVHKALKI